MRVVDLTGQRFGRLSVHSRHPINTLGGKARWICVCDCGKNTIVSSCNLRSGHTESCGCKIDEHARVMGLSNKTHGLTDSAEFGIWDGLKARCLNPNSKDYKNYGGRGIQVCDQWINSFEAFYADMGPRPSEDHSIEREDVNGNYEPGNCSWKTAKEQANNRRNNNLQVINGEQLTLTQVSERYGVSPQLLRKRMSEGMSIEQAITTPVRTYTKR